MIQFKRLDASAKLHTRGSAGAAGLDIYAIERVPPLAAKCCCLPAWLWSPPRCYYGRIAPRSGMEVKHGIQIHAGAIDSNYRGAFKGALVNHGDKLVELKSGDRIAQLIIERCAMDYAEWANSLHTEGGTGTFGSTGR